MTVREPFAFIRQYREFVLFCSFYLLGLIAGVFFISRFPISSLMHSLEYQKMSIVVGFFISAFPFVVFYIVFRFSAFFLVAPLAFIRAFVFMYCFAGVSIAYADAGWLVRCLLLFSDCFSVPLLIWYVSGVLLVKRTTQNKIVCYCLFLVLAIRCIDCYVISPFASELLSF